MPKFIFILFFSGLAFLPKAWADRELPVVSQKTFEIGRTWIWDYFEDGHTLYSSERYKVLKRDGEFIWIEMATEQPAHPGFKVHHLLKASLDKCLRAYRNRAQVKPWMLELNYLENGRWTPTLQSNTLAFEEKFNCNSHVHGESSRQFLTVFVEKENETFFQQRRWKQLESSWFFLNGSESAVTARKEFRSPGRYFEMRLRR